ncbi:hypothetical protein BGW39_002663, partial [Mortierella sp. 14UC]
TSLAGLQGLNNIEFKVDIGMGPVPPEYIDYYIASTVNIRNPSQLTLNIGVLTLEAGLDGWTDADWLGRAVIKNLRLVPGDNYVLSELTTSMSHPVGLRFIQGMPERDQLLTLRASSTSTSNPALNAGLSTLRNGVIIPKGLAVPKLPAYSDVWNIKVLPTTVDDGLIEVSTVFYNPYYMDMDVEGLCNSYDECQLNPFPSVMRLYDTIGNPATFLNFPQDFAYSVKANGSTPLTFKVQLFSDPDTPITRIQGIVGIATAKGALDMEIFVGPRVRLAKRPDLVVAAWSDGSSYAGHLNLKTGPDFPMIMDWFNKHQPVPIVLPSPTTSSLPSPTLLPPSPSVSPVSPSSPPVVPSVTPSPVVPSVTPSPVTSPSPVVSPSPTIAPAA